MKLFNGIKAFFTYKNEAKQIEVRKAIITPGKVILKPAGVNKIVSMKTTDVDIIINKLEELSDDEITTLDSIKLNKKLNSNDQNNDISSKNTSEGFDETVDQETKRNEVEAVSPDVNREKEDIIEEITKPIEFFKPKKKSINLSLYPDEYEMLSELLMANRYKRTEFILACISSAKKQSFASEYNRYTKEHKERRLIEREAALQAQEVVRTKN